MSTPVSISTLHIGRKSEGAGNSMSPTPKKEKIKMSDEEQPAASPDYWTHRRKIEQFAAQKLSRMFTRAWMNGLNVSAGSVSKRARSAW